MNTKRNRSMFIVHLHRFQFYMVQNLPETLNLIARLRSDILKEIFLEYRGTLWFSVLFRYFRRISPVTELASRAVIVSTPGCQTIWYKKQRLIGFFLNILIIKQFQVLQRFRDYLLDNFRKFGTVRKIWKLLRPVFVYFFYKKHLLKDESNLDQDLICRKACIK